MSDPIAIDLAAQIEELWKRRRELLRIRVSPPGPSADDKRIQRQIIDEQAIILLEKITALERIEDDRQASQIVVAGLTEQDRASAVQAMKALSRAVQQEQAFDALLDSVAALFRAADTLAAVSRPA
jgi:hypothetical protein